MPYGRIVHRTDDTELGRLIAESQLENARSIKDVYNPVEAARRRMLERDAEQARAKARADAEAAFALPKVPGLFNIGDRVRRRVKPTQVGSVKNITYHFNSTGNIKTVLVMWDERGITMPYETQELEKVLH